MSDADTVKVIRAALEREPRVHLHGNRIDIRCEGAVVTLEGEVDGIVAKKLSLELAGGVKGVSGIVDRLRLIPAEQMEDGAIRDHICDAFLEDLAFRDYGVRNLVKGEWEERRKSSYGGGRIDVDVADGVVTLNGNAGSLSHKRLAGVFAWWVPGSRDVINGLEVNPPMADDDFELADAVRLVLEKDPFVNASQIRVGCKNYVVTLDGLVSKPKDREMAEADAWYVFQVNSVVNRLQVVG